MELRASLGETHSQRINTLVLDVIHFSDSQGKIAMSPAIAQKMDSLRNFMFRHVYRTPEALAEERKVRALMGQLFRYYSERPEELPNEYREIAYNEGIESAACDYIAGMTDRYAVRIYRELFIPKSWNG